MQDVNNQPLLRGKSKSLADHREFLIGKKSHEFVVFGDNILECLTLLNPAVEQSDIWQFEYVVYGPIDQPLYVFTSKSGKVISV